MSFPVEKPEGLSIDAALIALSRDRVWSGEGKIAQTLQERPTAIAKAEAIPSGTEELPELPVIDRLKELFSGFSVWSVLAGLALVPFAAIVLLWVSLYGEAEPARVVETKATSTTSNKGVAAKSADAPPAPTTGQAAFTPEPPQSLAALARQIAEARKSIEALTTGEASLRQENSRLAVQLKETQEVARSSAGLVDTLKAAQTELGQDKARLEGQLRASEEQVTRIASQLAASQEQVSAIEARQKATQEQIAHLLDAKQPPQQRTKRVVSATPATASAAPPKPATTSSSQPAKPPATARPKAAQPAAAATSPHPVVR
jgi:hypothetical protein